MDIYIVLIHFNMVGLVLNGKERCELFCVTAAGRLKSLMLSPGGREERALFTRNAQFRDEHAPLTGTMAAQISMVLLRAGYEL